MTSESMTRLGIDLDGVLVEQNLPVFEYIREEHGIDFGWGDLDERDPYIPEAGTGYSRQLKNYRSKEGLQDLPAIPGGPEAVRELAEAYEIVIATHRRSDFKHETLDWLDAHDIPYDDIYHPTPDNKGEADIDILIEDYVPNLTAALDANVERGYLILRSSNLVQLPADGVTTAADLLDSDEEELVHQTERQWDAIVADLLALHE